MQLTFPMADFGVSGLRLDSINNATNWDFVKAYKEKAWALYNARSAEGTADPSKFLVIGEELSLPIAMLQQGCLDALWNENWLQRVRAVLLGESWGGDDFEWTVRKLVDCRDDVLDGGSLPTAPKPLTTSRRTTSRAIARIGCTTFAWTTASLHPTTLPAVPASRLRYYSHLSACR